MTQLHDLAKPFPARVVHDNPSGGGSYVAHHLYVQRLLIHLGGYSFERVDIIRGAVAGKPPNPNGSSQRAKDGTPDLEDAVVGVVCRLTVEVDGRTMVIEDVGDCESPHNWPHDGARMKDAMSDALKRCCARIGLGTHLYARSPDEYVLSRVLAEVVPSSPGGGEGDAASTAPTHVGTSEAEEPAGVNARPSGEASPTGVVSGAGDAAVSNGGTVTADSGGGSGDPAPELDEGRPF